MTTDEIVATQATVTAAEFLRHLRTRRVVTLPGMIDRSDPSVDVTFDDRVGRCYELAARYLVEASGADLVHGMIQGAGKPPLPHAWVERADGTVFEPTSGHRITAAEFADYFGPAPRVRYSRERAYAEMFRTGHWGSWEEDR